MMHKSQLIVSRIFFSLMGLFFLSPVVVNLFEQDYVGVLFGLIIFTLFVTAVVFAMYRGKPTAASHRSASSSDDKHRLPESDNPWHERETIRTRSHEHDTTTSSATAFASAPAPVSEQWMGSQETTGHTFGSDFPSHDMNPASGAPMINDSIDTFGNTYGTDMHSSMDHLMGSDDRYNR